MKKKRIYVKRTKIHESFKLENKRSKTKCKKCMEITLEAVSDPWNPLYKYVKNFNPRQLSETSKSRSAPSI